MGIIELSIISIGLAMDAFAVSICKGLTMKKMDWKKAGVIATYFGSFQAGMPLIGYLLGSYFTDIVADFDHWIAFTLLGIIGVNMVREAFSKEEKQDDKVDWKTMCMLAIATSIDALAVGITLAVLKTNMLVASGMIGIVAFALSIAGVKIGNVFGNKYEKMAQILGGVILIFIGLKIVVEHIS